MLKRHLQSNPKLHAYYRVFMNDIIEHGEAEAMPNNEMNPKCAYIFYIMVCTIRKKRW